MPDRAERETPVSVHETLREARTALSDARIGPHPHACIRVGRELRSGVWGWAWI